MVEFDASFALLIWRDVPASVDKARERVAHLINELTQKQERILIPTPGLTELLASGCSGKSVPSGDHEIRSLQGWSL
jgi:hypothetical protein